MEIEIVFRTHGVDDPDWTPDEKAALQYAVDILEKELEGPIPLRLIAAWEDLPRFVLAEGRPVFHIKGHPALVPAPRFPGIGNDVWYPLPLANQLMGKNLVTEYYADLYPDGEALVIRFNNDMRYAFYCTTDGQVPLSKWDFVETALHELQHGVGFSFQMDCVTGQLSQSAWDRYTVCCL